MRPHSSGAGLAHSAARPKHRTGDISVLSRVAGEDLSGGHADIEAVEAGADAFGKFSGHLFTEVGVRARTARLVALKTRLDALGEFGLSMLTKPSGWACGIHCMFVIGFSFQVYSAGRDVTKIGEPFLRLLMESWTTVSAGRSGSGGTMLEGTPSPGCHWSKAGGSTVPVLSGTSSPRSLPASATVPLHRLGVNKRARLVDRANSPGSRRRVTAAG